jgi:hypothetical protein
MGVEPSKFIKLAPWVTTKLWYLHKHTEGSVYQHHNVMLYIQKSVSANAANCSHRGRKIQKFSGGRPDPPPPPPPPPPPLLLLNAIPHQTFYCQQTIYHFSTLGIVWSLFVDAPHWQILKKCPVKYETVYTMILNEEYKYLINVSWVPFLKVLCIVLEAY